MDTKTLRESIAGMIANCKEASSDVTGKQKEVMEALVPAMLWDKQAIKAVSLTQLKLAYNGLNTLLGKLPTKDPTKDPA